MRTFDTLSAQERAALVDLQQRVRETLPGRSMRWTLFGSRARGDAEPDSDMDVLLELDVERFDLATKRSIRRLAGEVSLKRERGDYSILTNICEEGIPL
jgi:predicted nucleotidyltransferase